MSAKIALSLVTDKVFVWDVKDVQRLREEHHMTGILLGTLPQLSQQNVFLGLPLQLLPEEVHLLMKYELAYLVDDARAHVEATPEQVAEYKAARQDDILQQQTQHRQRNEERAAAMSLIHADKIAARRAEKSQARKAQPPPSELDPPETKQTAPDPVYTVKIKGSSQGLPWYQPEAHRYDSLDAVRAAGLWNYPRTALERAKCASFEELWKRGHYMGSGLRFGGDFLVYPGDPLRYHSHFSTTVVPRLDEPIKPIDLVAMGRLATAVKKAHLLCGYDPASEGVTFYSLEWAAMG